MYTTNAAPALFARVVGSVQLSPLDFTSRKMIPAEHVLEGPLWKALWPASQRSDRCGWLHRYGMTPTGTRRTVDCFFFLMKQQPGGKIGEAVPARSNVD